MRGGNFKKFYEAYYRQLEGKTIKQAGLDDGGYPYFILSDGTQCSLLSDEEGNGPGHLDGLPRPKV